VTDADVVLGRIDPQHFAGGRMRLDRAKAETALQATLAEALDLDAGAAAIGVSEMVDENMANAARVHAIESGQIIEQRTLVAFGGAAPLHAARLAEKLNMAQVVIPPGAGVGSAIGFLRAPVAFEVTRSYYQRLGSLDIDGVNTLLETMRGEALAVVEAGAGGRRLVETRTAFMRYVGQGHEVGVELPVRIDTARLEEDAAAVLLAAFEREYHRLYERTIPNLDVEILTWVLLVGTATENNPNVAAAEAGTAELPPAHSRRELVDCMSGNSSPVPVYERAALQSGMHIPGPAVILEKDTTTIVSARFSATIHPSGYIILQRSDEEKPR
jgi:N-methylhydantoinase A